MNKAVQSIKKAFDTSSERFIPYGRQSITQDDIEAVTDVLTSDFLTQGPKVPEFEKAVARYSEAEFAVAVNSATSALHIACLALDVGKDSRVWTSPITFVASANCALYCGADVDFVDIDAQTYNMSVDALEKKLLQAEIDDSLPDVVIPVHLSGQPCDMKAISKLSNHYGFSVIEDASHAIGANYANEPVGNCQYSDITVFSFHPVKIITSAEGGMALTNSRKLSEKMQLLRGHGVTRDDSLMQGDNHGPWYYQQIELGFNYRMTDLQAALGLSQLNRLESFVIQRNEIAQTYNRRLQNLPLTLPWQSPGNRSSWHLYIIRLQLDKIRLNHRQIFETLREAGIGVNLHYIPVHTQPFYKANGFADRKFPEAEKYYQEAISLPVFPGLDKNQQHYICDTLETVLLK